MWSFVVVVLYEFPVELESGMFLVVGSEPSFDLAEGGWFADSSQDMFDSSGFTIHIEAGFSSANAVELATVICEDLSWLRILVDGFVE